MVQRTQSFGSVVSFYPSLFRSVVKIGDPDEEAKPLGSQT